MAVSEQDPDPEIIAALAELARQELSGTAVPSPLLISPFSAYVVIGALQLTLRHPDMEELMRKTISGFAWQLATLFGPPLDKVIEAGFDPSQDVPIR